MKNDVWREILLNGLADFVSGFSGGVFRAITGKEITSKKLPYKSVIRRGIVGALPAMFIGRTMIHFTPFGKMVKSMAEPEAIGMMMCLAFLIGWGGESFVNFIYRKYVKNGKNGNNTNGS